MVPTPAGPFLRKSGHLSHYLHSIVFFSHPKSLQNGFTAFDCSECLPPTNSFSFLTLLYQLPAKFLLCSLQNFPAAILSLVLLFFWDNVLWGNISIRSFYRGFRSKPSMLILSPPSLLRSPKGALSVWAPMSLCAYHNNLGLSMSPFFR